MHINSRQSLLKVHRKVRRVGYHQYLLGHHWATCFNPWGWIRLLIDFCIKLYHLIKTNYTCLQKEQSEYIVDAKLLALRLQQNPSNASQNFIYEETICQKKMNQLEKSFDQINQMRETAISGSFPKHSQAQTHPQPKAIINDFHIRELIKDNEEIGARRKRRYKIVQEKLQQKPSPKIEYFDNKEIIKLQPILSKQKPQDLKDYQKIKPQLVSENSDYLEIIYMH